MKYFFYALCLSAIFMLGSCGSCVTGTGAVQEEERILQEFTAITLNCSADVIIRDRIMDEKNKVVIKAQPNILPLITAKVSGGELKLDIEGCTSTSEAIEIWVYVDDISKISNEGSGNIISENALHADRFEVNHNSSGNMQLIIKANRVDVNQDGSGKIKLDGNANMIDIDHSSSGECDAMALHAEEAKVNLNGSGNVSVFASKEMDLRLDGSGSILYGGKPGKLNTKDDGSGEIHEAQ